MPVWKDDTDGCSKASTGTLVSGVVLTGIGVLLLLDQIGIVNSNILWHLWPMIFVIVGTLQLIEARATGSQAWGAFLIAFGSLLTLHEFGLISWGMGELWPLFVIAAGLLMAWHGNEIRAGRPGVSFPRPNVSDKGGRGFNFPDIGSNGLHTFAFFGGIERKVEGKYFQGGNITAVFGGFKIDLTRADMDTADAIIVVNAIFGGGEIIAPESWRVLVEGAGIFGAFVDKTRFAPRPESEIKTLHVRGAAIFGGVEVKSW